MPQSNAANPLVQFFPLVLIFIIFYFLLIRPQKQKEKEHQKMLAGIDKNDEVVTSSGIHGTVVSVKEKTLILRIDENVKMEIEKSNIAYIKKP
ncbi:MAG: preprotein translocase subunit YajC [Candidatus Omnitrophica bacterium]|nr:preprotein translocase subunit YajC [Candidatus Omnitrophota bacterium]MBU4303720.1 preprotein translocase subunit YajC [Candidatus Omnitrophota bacterium]MBU4468493.1 preprotein translocase subunit YajC [Candidatus Omnitrophota bacterium]MCG2707668.1 preprotein translocase subunit YajC [Candidatus Omnitrophota bacterium]